MNRLDYARLTPATIAVLALSGVLIGGGAILPGISGGVLAVIFGFYRPMMELLAHPIKAIPKYWKMFVPVGIGWVIGFFGFAKLIELIFGEMDLAWSTVVQGLIRLAIFLLYIYGISKIKDIKRVFMYHGAEHKTIACYESELPMTPENAAKCTRLHPRCGTNYLFLTMAVSIVVTTVISALCTLIPGFTAWHDASGVNRFLFRIARIVLILPIAGISYEVLKVAAKRDNLVCRVARAPGLALQHLTTKEPTADMLEVAIASFELALHPPKGDLEFDEKASATKTEEASEAAEKPAEAPKTDPDANEAAEA